VCVVDCFCGFCGLFGCILGGWIGYKGRKIFISAPVSLGMGAREVEYFLSQLLYFENFVNDPCLFVDKTFREKVAIIKELHRQNNILRKIVDKNYNLMHIDDHNITANSHISVS
jgi:hypothetical protein